MDRGRLVFKAVIYIYENREKGDGDIFMDAPNHTDLEHLIAIAQDRDGWKGIVWTVKTQPFNRFQQIVRLYGTMKGLRPELMSFT